jgi:hypothetical protein
MDRTMRIGLTGIFVDNQDKAVPAGQPGAGPTGVLAAYQRLPA